MKRWIFLVKVMAVAILAGYFCFTYFNIALRIACFLVSVPLAIMAYCFLEHAVLFRKEWRTTTSGKMRTPPGPSIIAGLVFLALATGLIICCFHR